MIQTFDWYSPSWSLFIMLFWIVASVIYAFSTGKGRTLTILVSVYMAQLLVLKMPFLSNAVSDRFGVATGTMQQLVAFVILFALLFFFLGRYAFKSSADGRHFSALGFGIAFSVLQIGLLVHIILGYLPEHVQNSFEPLIQFVFLHPNAGFVWLVTPVVFLVLLGRFLSERHES